jgi:hypothetical protein
MRPQPKGGIRQGDTSAEKEMITSVVSDAHNGSGVTNIQE